MARLIEYLKEANFALRHAASLQDAVRLLSATAQFHLHPKTRVGDHVARSYTLDLNGMPVRLELRTFGGDLFVLYEVVAGGAYDTGHIPLPDDAKIIDLGANVGIATLALATRYPAARFFAVEPDLANFQLLQRNTSRFRDRIEVRNAAIARATGFAKFESSGPHWGRQLSDAGAPVATLTMADVLAASGFSHVDLLKVDIEGAESELFAGAVGWLDRVRAVMIELHGPLTLVAFTELMRGRGFDIVRSPAGTTTAVRR